jgi:hypothetical protein
MTHWYAQSCPKRLLIPVRREYTVYASISAWALPRSDPSMRSCQHSRSRRPVRPVSGGIPRDGGAVFLAVACQAVYVAAFSCLQYVLHAPNSRCSSCLTYTTGTISCTPRPLVVRHGLVAKFFAKWNCSKFRCYLAISVQSWSN